MSGSNKCFLKKNNGIRLQPPFKCQEQSVQDGHLNDDTWLSSQLGLGTPEDGRSETVQKRRKLGLWEEGRVPIWGASPKGSRRGRGYHSQASAGEDHARGMEKGPGWGLPQVRGSLIVSLATVQSRRVLGERRLI